MCQSSNRKSANCYFAEGPQIKNKICWFAICGPYLRTAHLWLYILYCNVHCTLKRKIFVVQYCTLSWNWCKRVPHFSQILFDSTERPYRYTAPWIYVITPNALIRHGKILKGNLKIFRPQSYSTVGFLLRPLLLGGSYFQVLYYKKTKSFKPICVNQILLGGCLTVELCIRLSAVTVSILISTMLQLPPLWFHYVGGCWDQNQETVETSQLAVRQSNHLAKDSTKFG